MLDAFSLEKMVENEEVYPITLMKFILSKQRIMSFFQKASDPNFEIFTEIKIDNSDCEACKDTKKKNLLCRRHTSITRIIGSGSGRIMRDLDTNLFFYKNEIYRMVGDKLVIVYCPHTKLIPSITVDNVKKVSPITIQMAPDFKLPEPKEIRDFISTELSGKRLKCWFNDVFTIYSEGENFFLTPNK